MVGAICAVMSIWAKGLPLPLPSLYFGVINPLGIWTSADNVDVPMTLEDMQGLFAAIVTRGSAIHARQREMKQVIDGMSRDELEAFQPGW